jgi:hypothetical protein
MKNKLFVIVTLLLALASCGDDHSQEELLQKKSRVWVCHNPLSELHGHACQEQINVVRGRYEECYWVGHQRVEDAFCWLLRDKDCNSSDSEDPGWMEWQEEHCPLLEE